MKISGLKGFTLIELLIVVAIVGILGAIALPYYRSFYIVRSKLTEVTNSMSTVASALGAYRHMNEAWPTGDIATFAALQTSLGISIPQTRISGVEVSSTGRILCTLTNIDPSVNGSNLTLSASIGADNAILWRWGSSNGMPPTYIPKQ
jgi:type IV pilus assembly protein PilA